MDDLIGKPYEKVGRCWGCVALVLRRMGINVPDYVVHENSGENQAEILAAIQSGKWERVEKPMRGDVVLFRTIPLHVGAMLDSEHFIHALKDTACVVEEIRAVGWRRRVEGFYRWIG